MISNLLKVNDKDFPHDLLKVNDQDLLWDQWFRFIDDEWFKLLKINDKDSP
jgi:hypothetical protein